jgi:hypothetical protein
VVNKLFNMTLIIRYKSFNLMTPLISP